MATPEIHKMYRIVRTAISPRDVVSWERDSELLIKTEPLSPAGISFFTLMKHVVGRTLTRRWSIISSGLRWRLIRGCTALRGKEASDLNREHNFETK
jgi:hypothetical protein